MQDPACHWEYWYSQCYELRSSKLCSVMEHLHHSYLLPHAVHRILLVEWIYLDNAASH
jgi:hypothetical protein